MPLLQQYKSVLPVDQWTYLLVRRCSSGRGSTKKLPIDLTARLSLPGAASPPEPLYSKAIADFLPKQVFKLLKNGQVVIDPYKLFLGGMLTVLLRTFPRMEVDATRRVTVAISPASYEARLNKSLFETQREEIKAECLRAAKASVALDY